MTGNEKLCKIYQNNYFLKMFKFLLTFFIDIINIITPVISYTQIAFGVMRVLHWLQIAFGVMCVTSISLIFTQSTEKILSFSITILLCRPCLLLEKRIKNQIYSRTLTFQKNFLFAPMIALQKCWKCFLFHFKSSFRSQDI